MAKKTKYDRSKKHLGGKQIARDGKLAGWFTELPKTKQKAVAKDYIAALKTPKLKIRMTDLLRGNGVL